MRGVWYYGGNLKCREMVTMPKTAETTKHLTEEKILASEPRFIDIYTQNAGKIRPLRMLFRFYKGYYGRLLLSVLFFIIKSSPTWILPLITARVIDLATNPPENGAAAAADVLHNCGGCPGTEYSFPYAVCQVLQRGQPQCGGRACAGR